MRETFVWSVTRNGWWKRKPTVLKKLIGWIYLGATGWRPEGELPPDDKIVIIAAPHTTNWDLPITIALSWALGVKTHWMGKKSIFRFPFETFMTALGGIPIDRSKRLNVVTQAAERIRGSERMILAVPPEGTRSGGDDVWKSGFYHIAREAGVPIQLGFLDYSRKRGGLGPLIHPTGDIAADMDQIRAFYRADMAKFPDQFREPRLRAEDEGEGEGEGESDD